MRDFSMGTVTFLLTDIEGSTRLWEQHPEGMRAALERHDALSVPIIEEHGGLLVKKRGEGDSVFAVFPRATDAVAAACEFQRRLYALEWPEGATLRVRMALHTGEAGTHWVMRDGDYAGPALNRCARLRAVAYGGQVLMSEVTQGLVRDDLPPEADLKALGSHRLRDLHRPEQIFQLVCPGTPAEFPPLRSLDVLPNNLPQSVTSFIGRERELADVKELLERATLLTLTGAGGTGKTRLSLQVAADVLDHYPDGVWLVELAPLTEPALVPEAVATVLGVKEEAGQTLLQRIVHHLASKRLLLLLDNCEHLIGACASVATAILRGCPTVQVLASSREALGIAGEMTYRVPSLSLPDPRRLPSLERLAQFEAVRLFIDRAVFSQPNFNVTNTNAPAVASICHRLDGIPLAIELAAARVKALPVEQLARRLDDRFRLLTGGSRTALPRQQTLRALIDWSFDLLSPEERVLLRRLSVFAGGFTLDAAEAICCDDGGVDVLDLLTALVDKSLVAFEDEDARYRMLQTVRQYARERLIEAGEDEVVRDRHLEFYLRFALDNEPKLAGPDQAEWLDRLEVEHDNFRAALEWSQERTAGSEPGLRLAGTLLWFWVVHCHWREGSAWLDALLQRNHDSQPAIRARALMAAGWLAMDLRRHEEARTHFEGSRALYEQLKDDAGVADVLHGLGFLAVREGDYSAAAPLYERSLNLRQQMNDQQQVAWSLAHMARLAHLQGDLSLARTHRERSLRLARRLGDLRLIGDGLEHLASIARVEGNAAAARPLYEESVGIYRELEQSTALAWSLLGLGNATASLQDDAAAFSAYQEGLNIFREMEHRVGVAFALERMAEFAGARGLPERAARIFGAAERLREVIAVPMPRFDREDYYDRAVANVRAAMGETACEEAWVQGRKMPLDDAIQYACSEPASVVPAEAMAVAGQIAT